MIWRATAVAALVAATLGPPASPDGEYDEPPPRGGVFRVSCDFSHRAPDDPIVHPGHEGMAHSHDFIGNRRTDAHSTYEDMVGNPSTCDRAGDDAAYWFPTLSNRGEELQPRVTFAYYRVGLLRDIRSIQAMPANLKMIAGSADSTGPQDIRIMNWACAGPGPEIDLDHVPETCDGAPLRLQFLFPNCWDGERLDSRDHKAHMRYSWQDDDDYKECPSSHPVQLPTLTISTRWAIDGLLDRVKLASGQPHTAHADFWNTWVQDEMERLVDLCIRRGQPCDD